MTLHSEAATDRIPPFAGESAGVLPEALLDMVLAILDDAKAEDVTSIDIRGKSALSDYMIIASGRSNRHVSAITDRLLRDLKKAGCDSPKVEGTPQCDWVLIDANDCIIHLFRPEVRSYYNIEKMWSEEPVQPRADA